MAYNNKRSYNPSIDALQLKIADEQTILKWSHGEVLNNKTINYKTFSPEEGGLFCETVFGPIKDYTCSCGKYKNDRSMKGKKCEKCGVDIVESSVRRERMGHIKLATNIVHPWFCVESLRQSKLSILLDISNKELEDIIIYSKYIVADPGSVNTFHQNEILDFSPEGSKYISNIKKITELLQKINSKISSSNPGLVDIINDYIANLNDKQPIDIDEVFEYLDKYFGIKIMTGGDAVKKLLENLDISKEILTIKNVLKTKYDKKLLIRLNTLKSFKKSGNSITSLVFDVLPVTPPETRPLVVIANGKFTTSDVNELYRKVIERNNRIKTMIENNYPKIIINTEKRSLQEAVNNLYDNRKTTSAGAKEFKSLSEVLKGKNGLFRQNLLGKRVDFSARSVIVGGPDLKFYECGIPIDIVLTIFEPFIISKLISSVDENGIEKTPICLNKNQAKKMIVQKDKQIFSIVNELINDYPVILNRAPTLHKLGMQAFKVKLVEGRAIQLHPLVCFGFNADFDGDTMAIHLPISDEAIAEAKTVLLSTNNLISPKDNQVVITPTIDMLSGNYYLTMEEKGLNGQGLIFSSVAEAENAYSLGTVDLHAIVGIDSNVFAKKPNIEENKVLITTVGKILLNNELTEGYKYVDDGKENSIQYFEGDMTSTINSRKEKTALAKANISAILNDIFATYGNYETARIGDVFKKLGFQYVTKSGITFSAFDLPSYSNKDEYIKQGNEFASQINQQYLDGEKTDDERYLSVINKWLEIKNKISQDVEKIIADKKNNNNSIMIMSKSGARGNINQLTQLIGIRGLMSKTFNYSSKSNSNIIRDIIDIPVKTNLVEGMKIMEYFNASYGARKGMVDLALKTPNSGYMTRKLVDCAQSIIVTSEDCGATSGLVVSAIVENGKVIKSLADRIVNRYAVNDITINDQTIVAAGQLISKENAIAIEKAGITEVEIRSFTSCKCVNGICQKCFGNSSNKPVEIGTAVGVIAAQSLGEPITQLNMKSFHTGGSTSGEIQLAQGYERLKQLLEVISPKDTECAMFFPYNAKVISVNKNTVTFSLLGDNTAEANNIFNNYGYKNEHKVIDDKTIEVDFNNNFFLPNVKVGSIINIDDQVTAGNFNLKVLLKIKGIEFVKNYIINEIQKVYLQQGIKVDDHNIEIIIGQMTSLLKIIDDNSNEDYLVNEWINVNQLEKVNNDLTNENKKAIIAEPAILSIVEIPSKSNSFLSSASFQYTKRALVDASFKGEIDHLSGIKENVMLGKLIPVGTRFKTKEQIIKESEQVERNLYK